MIGARVTIRYAKALFSLAKEEGILPRVASDLELLSNSVDDSEELRTLLESPVVGAREKQKVLSELFETKLSPVTFRFLTLLIEKKREDLLRQIIQRFMKLLDEDRGILRGELLTAYQFSEKQLQALKKHLDKITGKNVVLEQRVESNLLGGFVIRMEDTVIDSSLKNQLVKLHQSMTAGN